MLINWVVARTSYVFTITVELRGNILGNRSFLLSFILMIVQLLLTYVIEIFFTTDFEENEKITDNSLKRLIVANLFLLFAELFLTLTMILELQNLMAINFVRTIITGASFLSILINRSKYLIFWVVIISYAIAMVVLIFPRDEDNQQKPMEFSSLILFLRSIVLPV